MPKIEQKIDDLRGQKGYGFLEWKEFQNILHDNLKLTEQQRIVKVTIDENGIHYLTKAEEK